MVNALCDLCKSDNGVEVYKSIDLRAVMCKQCALVYLNPRRTQAEYDKFYAESYQKSRHGLDDYEQSISRLLNKKSYEKKFQAADIFAGILRKDSRVLEIGSGWGTMLRVLADRFGCEVAGVEISELAVKVSKEFYKLDIKNTSFANYLSSGVKNEEKFDLVIVHHVLEHFLEPLENLQAIKKLLKPAGRLYVAVPNVNKPEDPLDRFFHFEHCYYFSAFTLGNMLARAGFTVEKVYKKQLDLKILAAASMPNVATQPTVLKLTYEKIKTRLALWRQKFVYTILRFLKFVFGKMFSEQLKKRVIILLKKIKMVRV